MNLPKDFYNVTTGINGQLLPRNYKGGLFCCQDNVQCKLRNGIRGPTRKLSLRYKIKWVDWDEHQVPLKFYILDSTDRVRSNGSTPIHDCQVNNLFNTYNTLQIISKLLKLIYFPNKSIRPLDTFFVGI